ncbi:SipW-dependent-type signal peptide-containing protein [Microbacterium sp. CJ88]|uniref:SipW-dependent-type signal peptide-containing protein n=1 Tax=Microbacterium sp. CJ88 TaxID=3445672 RepID=UPI003F65B6D4
MRPFRAAAPEDRQRGRRWPRLRALLAGGLVLGIGATVTLAAWTDSEYTAATLTAGRFGILGSMNGAAFADHATSPGATLTFSPALGAVYPGAPPGFTTVQIRTASTASGGFNSVAGTVSMQTSTAATGGLAGALVYAVRVIPTGSSCNEALFSNAAAPVIVPNATPLTTAVGASAANVQTVAASAGSTVSYCVRIALPLTAPDGIQNSSTPVVWQFAGTT